VKVLIEKPSGGATISCSDVSGFEVEDNGCLIIYYKEDKDFPTDIEEANKVSHYEKDEWESFEAMEVEEE